MTNETWVKGELAKRKMESKNACEKERTREGTCVD